MYGTERDKKLRKLIGLILLSNCYSQDQVSKIGI